ncbi:hypothetical protein SAMN06296386_11361 [Lachnospiraceae bacterium]|nr:hypothetical protein SAMN06296386_11361 [Lachnospiraceae bacterium]
MSELYLNKTAYDGLVNDIETSVVDITAVTSIPTSGTYVLSDIIDLNADLVTLSEQYKEHVELDLVPSLNKTETELMKVGDEAESTLTNTSGDSGEG